MNILQVSPYAVHPPQSGGEKRISGITSAMHGHNFSRYSLIDLSSKQKDISIADSKCEYWRNNLSYSVFSKILNKVGIPPIVPPFIRLNKLDSLISDSQIILCEHPWLFDYINTHATNQIIVYSSHNVEYERLGKNKITKVIIKRIEKQAVENSDLVITTTVQDKSDYLKNFKPKREIKIIPNGSNIPRNTTKHKSKRINILFVGSDYGPNIEGVNYITQMAKDIDRDDIVFHIVGSVCDHFSTSNVPSSVALHGYVDDISKFYENTQIAVNPIISGSGSNVKVPEYFSYSIPVITTEFGARGIPAVEDQHFLVRELDEFSEAIISLANNIEVRKRIGSSARSLIENDLNWELLSQKVLYALRKLYHTRCMS